jgi:hypothetical protein
VSEPPPDACSAAIQILLHGLGEQQRAHAFGFLLGDLERLYLSAGCSPPAWINTLRARGA